MKQFLQYLAIFIFPILIIGVCAEALLRRIPNDYLYKRNFLDQNSKNVKVLFLGNSHVYYGINPEYVSFRSFNASHISQSLDYDLEILRKYDNKWDSLKYIVIAVDYFSFYSKLENTIEAWRIKNYQIYYDIKNSNKISNHSEILTNNLKINLNRLYRFYCKNDDNITSSKLGWGTAYNSTTKQDLTVSGKISAQRHFMESDQYFNENVKTLKSIIEFSKKRDIEVLLFTSPAYKSYVQNLDKLQLGRTIDTVNKIANSNPNVTYFNLLTNKTFTENDFYDADHLNDLGAKILTLKVDSLLVSIDRHKNALRFQVKLKSKVDK